MGQRQTLAEASGTENFLPVLKLLPFLCLPSPKCCHSTHPTTIRGVESVKKGRSEMGGLKIKNLYMEGLLVPKLFFLSMAVTPSLFN